MYSKKRKASAAAGVLAVYKRQKKQTIPPRLKGFLRTGGAYGRFGGPAGELKFFDTALSFAVDATGEVPATGQLALIPQGVTESTRVGRKATIKSIQIRGTMTYVPAASATGVAFAVIYVVQDTQCNGEAAAVTDVLDSNDLPSAMINLDNSMRFRILKKLRIPFVAPSGIQTAFSRVVKNLEVYMKCNIPLEFSSTTGAITELRSNNIFLLAGSDSGGDDTVNVIGTCRLRFTDY